MTLKMKNSTSNIFFNACFEQNIEISYFFAETYKLLIYLQKIEPAKKYPKNYI